MADERHDQQLQEPDKTLHLLESLVYQFDDVKVLRDVQAVMKAEVWMK